MAECKHEYAEVEDWEGDPSIPNGKHYLYYWRCVHCGDEVDERPPEDQICEPDFDAIYEQQRERLRWR